jgi:hypothetical protein
VLAKFPLALFAELSVEQRRQIRVELRASVRNL